MLLTIYQAGLKNYCFLRPPHKTVAAEVEPGIRAVVQARIEVGLVFSIARLLTKVGTIQYVLYVDKHNELYLCQNKYLCRQFTIIGIIVST